MRQFNTGATRDTSKDKLDYEGFFNPIVLYRIAQYLHEHRTQADGTLRDSDNWQKGIPTNVYAKSGVRHGVDVWLIHRGFHVYRERTKEGEVTHVVRHVPYPLPESWKEVTLEDALCACIFNDMGYLYELLKDK
jgi:hypothetical protein